MPFGNFKKVRKKEQRLSQYQPDYKKRMMFYQNHIDYLTNGNGFKLFMQNFSPYYKGMKTKKPGSWIWFLRLNKNLNPFNSLFKEYFITIPWIGNYLSIYYEWGMKWIQ